MTHTQRNYFNAQKENEIGFRVIKILLYIVVIFLVVVLFLYIYFFLLKSGLRQFSVFLYPTSVFMKIE